MHDAEAASVVAIIAVSISLLAVFVSGVSTYLILRAADRRFTAEQDDRRVQRKREAIAEVLATAATWRDATSGLIVRQMRLVDSGISQESGSSLMAWIEASYVPAHRDLLTSVSVAQLTVSDSEILNSLVKLLDSLAESMTASHEITGAGVERLKMTQKAVQKEVSELRARALRLYNAQPERTKSVRQKRA